MADTRTTQVQVNSWQRPLFGSCFDNTELCLFTYFCPCVTFGYNAQRLHQMQDKDCMIYGCLYMIPGVHAFLGTTTRRDIREERAIEGTVVNDCVTHVFCPCCSLMQEQEELAVIERSRPPPPQSTEVNVITSQPQPPPDTLTPATEETPCDPADDQDLGESQEQNRY